MIPAYSHNVVDTSLTPFGTVIASKAFSFSTGALHPEYVYEYLSQPFFLDLHDLDSTDFLHFELCHMEKLVGARALLRLMGHRSVQTVFRPWYITYSAAA